MTKPAARFQARDLIIGILALGLIATNVYWHQMYQGVDLSLQNAGTAFVHTQSEIAKLKLCVDTGTKPCDISSTSAPSQ
jgi:hypothetical protein